MAFKIVDDPFGQLTFTRIYQGTIKKGETYYNQRTGRKAERFSRIVRMHSDKREEIDEARLRATLCRSWASTAPAVIPTRPNRRNYCTLESIFVPEPVIKSRSNPTQPCRRRQAGQSARSLPQGRPDVPAS